MIKVILLTFFIFLSTSLKAEENFSHGISVFGDLKYPKNFSHLDYVNPSAPKAGVAKFASEGSFNSLNQFILKGIPAEGLSYLYDSLMEGADDEISSRYGLVAEGVRLDEDGMEFKLRQNAFFHDGKQITADDVVFTFNILVKEGHPSYKMVFREVKKVDKIDKFRVKFFFSKNHNRNLPITIASMVVLPKHYYEKVDFAKTTLTPPLGSGPYKIKEIKAGKSIVYVRNENYWAKNLPINRGRYNFNQISFDYYRDNNVLIEAFKAERYDFRVENIARNWANAYNIQAVKDGKIIKTEARHHLPSPMQAFVLNLRKQKFQDLALRKAITYAFDFEWLQKHIFYNSYKRTESYFANSEFAYKGFSLPKSNGDGFNRQNIIEAKKILDQAGYYVLDGQLFSKNGELIEIEFLINSPAFEMVIAPFVKNLKKLGIVAKVRLIEENQYQTRVNNFDFDVIVGVFGQALIPGNELFGYWHSSQKNVKGSHNLSGLDDKIVDRLIEKIIHAKERAELRNLCQKLDKRMLENYYLIPEWYSDSYRILYRDIFAMPKTMPSYSIAIDSWWIKNK